jgi:hypothetical protein
VLGIEEGRAWSAHGYAAAAASNPLSESGVPTVLHLRPEGAAEVRHVVGGLPLPGGWSEIAAVETVRDSLELRDVSGASFAVPFDAGFLARR